MDELHALERVPGEPRAPAWAGAEVPVAELAEPHLPDRDRVAARVLPPPEDPVPLSVST